VTEFRLVDIRKRYPDVTADTPHYVVEMDGTDIGVIVELPWSPAEKSRWQWSVIALPRARGALTIGTCATRQEAMADFRKAWELADIDVEAHRRQAADVDRRAALFDRRGR
jgi:hypothetical protein